MSRLSDLINEEVARILDAGSTVDAHEVFKALRPRLDADDEDQLIQAGAMPQIAAAVKRGHALSIRLAREGQPSLPFGIEPAYSLGDQIIKLTRDMTQLEFNRCISIREKQLADDTASLNRMRQARDATAPIFAVNPALTMGQALDRVAGRSGEAA